MTLEEYNKMYTKISEYEAISNKLSSIYEAIEIVNGEYSTADTNRALGSVIMRTPKLQDVLKDALTKMKSDLEKELEEL